MDSLRKIEAGLSGEDYGLRNAWEEICVQVQDQHSIDWDAYIDTIDQSIIHALPELPDYWREAIWLQTPEGEDWTIECELDAEEGKPPNRVAPPVETSDIAEYISQYVLSRAADWSNRRIRRFLEASYRERYDA